ncbi:hypothetical protein [Mucilaginibacter flavidus]|uniref:hypothetical protein n=1 Tax=Mucilaginibacter flavidus TaxID=2949309 RepID=UPI002093E6E1|nr:hypothetical protein [Mucilaginibacter flavidus]MCO5945351.1 hypothetical protein [Mucilaginibacter flavidus]
MVTNLLYSLKIWLTSVTIAPVFYIMIPFFRHFSDPWSFDSIGETYFLLLFYELLFSFITWFLFFVFIILASGFISNEMAARWTICIAGVLMVAATFILTILPVDFLNPGNDFTQLMLLNCLCIGLGSWIYKLKLYKHPEPDTQINP